jgi:hypothetical protein
MGIIVIAAGIVTMVGTAVTIGIIAATGIAAITGTDLRFGRTGFLPRIGKNTGP